MLGFYTTGGTLHHDSPSYVERKADKDVYKHLKQGDFCYVLTSRQMGKSSLMVRATSRLRAEGVHVVVLDLTAIGQNISPEQWYDGLLVRAGRQLKLEDDFEDFWVNHQRRSPVQRWFAAFREIALPKLDGPVVIFVDELDVVRSLPFSTDEFFGAIRECYNSRSSDAESRRLAFCLLGVATPSELMTDPRNAPFNIGYRVPLNDFSGEEAAPLARGLELAESEDSNSKQLLERILHWTHGHPYLTQRLCRAAAESVQRSTPPANPSVSLIDELCEELFLSSRAREQDDNLLFVRERLLRTEADLASLLDLYENILKGEAVPDDDTSDLINQLLLAGIARIDSGTLVTRNRIYERVFNEDWVQKSRPIAELEIPDDKRIRIKENCTLGRTDSNDVQLPEVKVSRRHAIIQKQAPNELWLVDLGSRNGTFLNGAKVTRPMLLRDKDRIDIGPFRLKYHQPGAPREDDDGGHTTMDKTVVDI